MSMRLSDMVLIQCGKVGGNVINLFIGGKQQRHTPHLCAINVLRVGAPDTCLEIFHLPDEVPIVLFRQARGVKQFISLRVCPVTGDAQYIGIPAGFDVSAYSFRRIRCRQSLYIGSNIFNCLIIFQDQRGRSHLCAVYIIRMGSTNTLAEIYQLPTDIPCALSRTDGRIELLITLTALAVTGNTGLKVLSAPFQTGFCIRCCQTQAAGSTKYCL